MIRVKILIVLIYLSLLGCGGQSTETGNPGVTINFSEFDKNTASSNKLSPVMPLSVQQVTLCFKRLRFKSDDDSSNDSDNIDIELGQVTLSPTGSTLGTFNVPAGIYDRIEFDLEDDCLDQGAPSVIVDNDNDGGTPFQTNDRITIRFDGSVIITANKTLELAVGNIIDALDGVTNSNQIKTVLEDAGSVGEF